jgi:hypothetical protein
MSKKKSIQKGKREVVKLIGKEIVKVTKTPYLEEEEDIRILYRVLGFSQ